MYTMALEYRSIVTSDEFEQAVEVQRAIWRMDDLGVVPTHVLIAMQHAGGLVLGAFDGTELVGFSAGFLAVRDGKLLHWSHITGILPAYQGRGVGSALKWLQRQKVLEQGLDCIGWTYDPLQRGNAAFNLNRLGCVCNQYHQDFYGEMKDGLNAGLASDRFEIRWWLKSGRVRRRQQTAFLPLEVDVIHRTLSALGDGAPGEVQWPGEVTQTLVEVPGDINQLKRSQIDLAHLWRLRTREAFTRLFSEGFVAVDFASRQEGGVKRHWYVLQRGITTESW